MLSSKELTHHEVTLLKRGSPAHSELFSMKRHSPHSLHRGGSKDLKQTRMLLLRAWSCRVRNIYQETRSVRGAKGFVVVGVFVNHPKQGSNNTPERGLLKYTKIGDTA